MLIQLSKTSFEIHFYRAASKPKRVRQNASSYQQNKKKRAALFGGRPLLETGMLFQDGQVTSRTL
jgi:hypothetical protein